MRVRRDSDLDAGECRGTGVSRREIESVRTRIDLEEAAVLLGMDDYTIHINFVAGTFQQEPPRRVSENVEVPIIHRMQDALGLLGLVQAKARMNGTDRVVELL